MLKTENHLEIKSQAPYLAKYKKIKMYLDDLKVVASK